MQRESIGSSNIFRRRCAAAAAAGIASAATLSSVILLFAQVSAGCAAGAGTAGSCDVAQAAHASRPIRMASHGQVAAKQCSAGAAPAAADRPADCQRID